MLQVQVTIGRNIGREPMSASLWQAFQSDVAANLDRHTTGEERWTEVHYGTGTWDGVTEESARVTILGVDDLDGASLTRALGVLAYVYSQDAVALSIGTSALVAAAA